MDLTPHLTEERTRALAHILTARPNVLGEDTDAHLAGMNVEAWLMEFLTSMGGLATQLTRYRYATHEALAHQGSAAAVSEQGWSLMQTFARLGAMALAAVEVYVEHADWGIDLQAPPAEIWRPGEEQALDAIVNERERQMRQEGWTPAQDKAHSLTEWRSLLRDYLAYVGVAAVQDDFIEFRHRMAQLGALAMAALEATHVDPQDQPEASGG